jgi:hypothetical protein
MRNYKIILECNDFDNPNEVNHFTRHEKEINEEIFNTIYKLII